MKETEKYISYQVMTNNLILTKPYYDIKGNKWIELRIKKLLYPYASININSKYFKLQYNKDYCFIIIFKNQNFYIKNKDGKIEGEISLEKIHPFLLEMNKQVLIKKAEQKQIYQENLKYFNSNKFPKKRLLIRQNKNEIFEIFWQSQNVWWVVILAF
ncbi:hypothetical protein [Spiroplasma citri]|uniref:hypothetical protein n=1 Tax=Spiroplasma citri TaxID=2133 RepID=UPI00148AF6BD|nr:hypothetical protein [Spiroplasma citri]QJU61824.1 hypothetical protein HHA36_05320 [Spiroplasma citri]